MDRPDSHPRVAGDQRAYGSASAGTDDPHLGQDHYAEVAGPINREEIDVAIGVTHAPYRRVIDAMAYDGHDLIIAGHTHGGQVCVPFYGALVTNCDLDTRRARVSRRTAPAAEPPGCTSPPASGTSPYAPIRFACPPEATLLTLTLRRLAERRPPPAKDASGRELSARLSEARCEYGVWRSLVARFVRDDEVAGSNPVTPTSRRPGQTHIPILGSEPQRQVQQQSTAARSPCTDVRFRFMLDHWVPVAA